MSKFPDGWILQPKMKNASTIEIEQNELITCQHCKHCRIREILGRNLYACGKWGMPEMESLTEPNGFCYMAEREE